MYNKVLFSRDSESGAVAIFTAIFFLLLTSVMTIGFLRIMLQERSQAIDNDLSQSALNSAQAGVEDAKRVVKWYNENCLGAGNTDCTQIGGALSSASGACDVIYGNPRVQARVGGFNLISGNGGVQVSGDGSFNQAYTCLTVKMNTPKLPGTLREGVSDMIPLKGMGNFTTVKLRWYSSKDTGGANATFAGSPIPSLVDKPSWPVRRPPMIRAELISHPGGSSTFRMDDVVSKTRFLYPYSPLVGTTNDYFGNDINQPFPRENTVLNPTVTTCSTTPRPGGMYYCEVNLYLNTAASPQPYNPSTTDYYLRLTSIYKGSDYQLELFNGATVVDFNGVQPMVDVTGRANDVYRRLVVGIRPDGADYPENALETAQQLCKNFRVSSVEADYTPANCAPAP